MRQPTLLLLLALLPSILAQSPSTTTTSSFVPGPRTSATAAASSTTTPAASSVTTPTATPSLIFVPISPVTACGSAQINWQLYNENPALYDITLSVMNLGVDQSIPVSATPTSTSSSTTAASSAALTSAAATSAAITSAPSSSTTTPFLVTAQTSSSTTSGIGFRIPSRSLHERTDLLINATVVVQNANVGFAWSPIGLPEGRYFLVGNVNDQYGTQGVSTIFTVLNGTDMSCLANSSLVQGATWPNSASTAATSSASSSATLAAGSSSGGGGISTGGIVGLVVGIIVGMGIVGLIVWCCIRRKRRAEDGEGGYDPEKWDSHRVGSHDHDVDADTVSEPRSIVDEHPPQLNHPMGGLTPLMFGGPHIGGISIRSSRPESVGDMGEERHTSDQSDDGSKLPVPLEVGSNPFNTPQPTPLHEPSAAPLANPQAPFMAGATAKEVRRASSPVATTAPPLPAAERKASADEAALTRSTSMGEMGELVASPQMTSGPSTPSMARNSSKRGRKPVPSLGPDLRGEIERHNSDPARKGSSGGSSEDGKEGKDQGKRQSFKLVPDMPLRQD